MNENHLALWAGLTAFLAGLLAVNVAALLGEEDNPLAQAIVALVTALVTGLAVYSKQRLDDEKRKRERRETP